MKSIFRATAVLSGSSVLSILISLASTKVLATILNPQGYGYYGLLQSFLAVTSLMAGMGLATGTVRLGASPAAAGDYACLAQLRAGAWLLVAALGLLSTTVFCFCRSWLSEWALGSTEHTSAIVLMSIALWFTVAVNLQNGLLNAFHRVEALAAASVVSAIVTSLSSIVCVLLWRQQGVAAAIVTGAAGTWVTSRWFLTRHVPRFRAAVSLGQALHAARQLLAFGVPFTASSLVGSGVQLALPIVVLHLLNTEAVAYYKAAAAVSVSYLGFLVSAMGQDYYPRLSAVRDQPQRMVALIQEQYRLVILLSAPMILATLALVPVLIPLIYSRRFVPAIEILEWQLIGDLFKFSSWTFSFAVLARCNPAFYFCIELVGGVSTLLFTWAGVRIFGMSGIGLGFVITYAVYYLAARTVLRRELPFAETAGNLRTLATAVCAALAIRVFPATPLAPYRTVAALTLAAGFAAYSARALWSSYLSVHWMRHAASEAKVG